MAGGLLLAALGMVAAAALPGLAGILVAAALIGLGAGLATPLGFAHLAATTPTARLGQTMGAAEIGRELGDAGGPLHVGALAAATALGGGLLGLAAVLAVSAAAITLGGVRRCPDTAQSEAQMDERN
jgi:sugar phosphate permease